MDLSNLGRALRERRKALKLTQLDVAKRVGVTSAYISEVEIGTDKLTLRTLAKIGAALDLDVVIRVRVEGEDGATTTEDLLEVFRAAEPPARHIATADRR